MKRYGFPTIILAGGLWALSAGFGFGQESAMSARRAEVEDCIQTLLPQTRATKDSNGSHTLTRITNEAGGKEAVSVELVDGKLLRVIGPNSSLEANSPGGALHLIRSGKDVAVLSSCDVPPGFPTVAYDPLWVLNRLLDRLGEFERSVTAEGKVEYLRLKVVPFGDPSQGLQGILAERVLLDPASGELQEYGYRMRGSQGEDYHNVNLRYLPGKASGIVSVVSTDQGQTGERFVSSCSLQN